MSNLAPVGTASVSPFANAQSLPHAESAQFSDRPLSTSSPDLLDQRMQQLQNELNELKQKKEEERLAAENAVREKRRELILGLPAYLGLITLNDVITEIRNQITGDKGRRLTETQRTNVDDAIRAGMTASEAKRHFKISPAAYYKRKSALGLTRPFPRKGSSTKSRSQPKNRRGVTAQQ